jgi:hypothetical protein
MFKEIIKISAREGLGLYEQKLHRPWFDDECSEFLDQRKQAQMQQLQDPNHSNVDNPNSASLEASEHFSNIHVHQEHYKCCH